MAEIFMVAPRYVKEKGRNEGILVSKSLIIPLNTKGEDLFDDYGLEKYRKGVLINFIC